MNRQQVLEIRRQRGEIEWKNRFDDLGLSDRFEFICRDWDSNKGKKARIKCKICGIKFSTWGMDEIIKGRQSHLLCPECGSASDGEDVWNRSKECEEAMAYYIEGHSVSDTAEHFGVSESQINAAVKFRHLTNGRKWGERSQKFKEKEKLKAINKISERLCSYGFTYVEGYTTGSGKVKIKCMTCGDEFERSVDFVKHGKLTCRKCEHKKTLIRQKKQKEYKKIEAEQRRVKREADRKLRNPNGLSYYQLHREKLLDETYICKVCGNEYTPRQYMESEGLTLFSNIEYCSHECKRKAMNRLCKKYKKIRGINDNHRHRAVKYGCVYDPSVTLKRLIERDGLRCAICGGMCDPDDHSWSEYTGPMSPSIDHIIPMAKGGSHTWDNVQIAHVICNSNKGDSLEEVM